MKTATRVRQCATVDALPRGELEALIQRHLDAAERLISFLDDADGDVDLEPTLGSLNQVDQTEWSDGGCDEREKDEDFEPALGWTASGVLGGSDDIEIGVAPVRSPPPGRRQRRD